jgi:glycosyltransferase involved in cell wall biosynthesis
MKKKILFIANRFYPELGGAEIYISRLAKTLSDDFEITVLTPKRMKLPRKEYHEGYTIYRFYDVLNLFGKYPKDNAKTLCPGMFFHSIFKRYNLIQCFPSLHYNGMVLFLLAKLKKIPFVLCSFDYLDYAAIIQKTGQINHEVLEKHRPSHIRRLILPKINQIFAISNKEIAFLKKFNKKVNFTPVPVLLDEYKQDFINPRIKNGISKEDFVFLMLGRVSKIKGQDLGVAAFIKAKKNIPKAKLIIIGRTDLESIFAEKIKQQITEYKKDILLMGEVERDEVLGWLKYCNIHVIPVRFMNSGAVVTETWASNTPVLQSNVVDPQLVIDNVNGFIFNSEDIEDLSKKMVEVYNKKNNLDEMAKSGRDLVLESFTYAHLANIYKEKYRDLIP